MEIGEIVDDCKNDEPEIKKSRWSIGAYDDVIPSRKTIAHMVKTYALLSFTDMAERIQEAKVNEEIVTYGVDDTVKAAGNSKYDVKTGHITIIGDNKERETFTTGFHENPTCSGVDAAKT